MREDIEVAERFLCGDCIGEAFLRREIKLNGEEQTCDYCDLVDNCFTIAQVAERVDQAFAVHYERTSTEPSGYEYAMMADKESDYDWERPGDQAIYAIMDAVRSSEEIAEDIQAVLKDTHYDFDEAAMGEESEFDDDAHYERKQIGDENWQTEWQQFEKTLKTESRYFNQACIAHLQALFGNLNELRTSERRPVIVVAGPGEAYRAFYRARVFMADDHLKKAMESPASQLGPPPALAAVAGRMNARGIAVFYGANTAEVALAEVRPVVGCKVVIARFELTRNLRLLDLSALQVLERSGSIFDDAYAGRLEKATFLKNLSNRITMPVLPGAEDLDYLATQAIADFLASSSGLALDGIHFPSVQSKGKSINVVLFHKAALVESVDLPKGSKIEAQLGMYGEDGWEPFYRMTELVPPTKAGDKNKQDSFPFDDLLDIRRSEYDPDDRQISLKIVLDSITVHEVESVRFKTTAYQVYRSRYNNWKGNEREVTDD
jgi:hypothetical protein